MAPLSGKKPHEMKTTFWSLVYWFTDGRNRETLDLLVQNMPTDWHLEGQIEEGGESQDKRHGQFFLKTPQCRGTRIAKFFPHTTFDEGRKFHALKNYVHKEETRVEEYKTVENRSPQWHVVCDKFFEYLVTQVPDSQYIRDENEKWSLWDAFINDSIREGMRIEIIGINPQYRGCINKYWSGFWDRTYIRLNVSKTETIVDKCLDKDIDKVVAPPPPKIPTILKKCRAALIS